MDLFQTVECAIIFFILYILSSYQPHIFYFQWFFYESNIWWHQPLLHNFILLLFNKIIFHALQCIDCSIIKKKSFIWGKKIMAIDAMDKKYCFSIATVIWSTWNDEGVQLTFPPPPWNVLCTNSALWSR